MCATVSTSSYPAVAAPDTLRYSYFRSIDAAGNDWDLAAPAHDLFLQRPYLNIVESNPPEGMRFGYLVFYRQEEPASRRSCQSRSGNAFSAIVRP